jgi:hypothetical protein
MDHPWVRLIAAVVFLAFGLLLVFDFWKQPNGQGLDSLPVAVQIALPMLVYAVTGFVIGRWWVLALLLVPILIAIPVGPITADEDKMPVYVAFAAATLLFLAPIAIAGVGARQLWDHGRRRCESNQMRRC